MRGFVRKSQLTEQVVVFFAIPLTPRNKICIRKYHMQIMAHSKQQLFKDRNIILCWLKFLLLILTV